MGVERIVSSPFVRAIDSVKPLAAKMGLEVEVDERLMERVLSDVSLSDWRDQLAASFIDMDLCLPGGESSRDAMERGVGVLEDTFKH